MTGVNGLNSNSNEKNAKVEQKTEDRIVVK